MSVETLRPACGRMGVAPITTVPHIRLLTKGPHYFRRLEAPGVGRPSAVERLEADKAKYVKSQQVMRTKQEPVRASTTPSNILAAPSSPQATSIQPLLTNSHAPTKTIHTCDMSSSSQTTPSRPVVAHTHRLSSTTSPLAMATSLKTTPISPSVTPLRSSALTSRRPLAPNVLPQAVTRKTLRPDIQNGTPLNLETLSNLINMSDTLVPPPTSDVSLATNRPKPHCNSGSPSIKSTSGTDKPDSGPPLSPPGVAVRRVDVRPAIMQGTPLRTQLRLLQRPQQQQLSSVLSPPPASPASSCSLQRSKSDLSDRFSRAPADLERFFNYCGLDPSDMEGLAWTGSDITSLSRLRSASAPGSEHGGPSQGSDRDLDEDASPAGRVPYGISVIERNARVIKWLYGLRQVCTM